MHHGTPVAIGENVFSPVYDCRSAMLTLLPGVHNHGKRSSPSAIGRASRWLTEQVQGIYHIYPKLGRTLDEPCDEHCPQRVY